MANPRLANQMMIDNNSILTFAKLCLESTVNCKMEVRKISLCLLDLRF